MKQTLNPIISKYFIFRIFSKNTTDKSHRQLSNGSNENFEIPGMAVVTQK
jgi:hypothetical protein